MTARKKPGALDIIFADYADIERRALAHMARDFVILDDTSPDTPEQREAARKSFDEFVRSYGYPKTKENDT